MSHSPTLSKSGWVERLYGYDLFLSYTRQDDPESAFARALQARLSAGSEEPKRRTMRCFLDLRDMPHDDEMRRAIAAKISASRFLLLIAGPHSATHEWMCFEAEIARKHGKRIIVIDRGIGWVQSTGLLKQKVGNVLAIPSDPGVGEPDEALIQKISAAVGTRRQATIRQRLFLFVMVVLVAAVGAAVWSGEKARKNHRESVRSEALALFKTGLGKIPQEDDLRASLARNEVPSDESTREAMALLAQAVRLHGDYRPAVAALSHLIHQRSWPLPVLAVPHGGILSNTSPRFAGAGHWLITCPPDTEPDKLVVWEMESDAEPVEITLDPGEELQCFAAAKIGTLLFIGSRRNKVYLYDLEKHVADIEIALPAIPLWLACSDDGSRLAIGCSDGEVRLRRVTDGKASEVEAKADGAVQCLALDAAGDWLAAGSATGKLWVWKCEPDGLKAMPIEASVPIGTMLLFHGQPAVLAAGSHQGVRVFDLQTFKQAGADSSFAVRSLFTSPLGGLLAWGRERQKLEDWTLGTRAGTVGASAAVEPGVVPDLAAALEVTPVLKSIQPSTSAWQVSGGQRYPIPALDNPGGIGELGTSSDASLRLHVFAAGNWAYLTTMDSLLRGTLLPEVIHMPTAIQAVVAHPADASLLLADRTQAVLWQPGAPRPRPWLLHAPGIAASAFSPDGQRFAVVQESGELKVWNCTSGGEIFSRALVAGKSWKLEWSADGKSLSAFLENKSIFRISADGEGEPRRDEVPKDFRLGPVLTDTAGKAIGITSKGELGVWDLTAKGWLFPPAAGFSGTESLVALADGKMVGVVWAEAAGQPRSVQLFSAADGKAKSVKLPLEKDAASVLSPRGAYAALQTGESFSIRRVSDGSVVWASANQQARVTRVVFSADEKRFATEALDLRRNAENLQLWDLPAGRPAGGPHGTPPILDGGFSADGQFFFARSPGRWEVFDAAIGVRVASWQDDLMLATELGAEMADMISVTDPAGCWRATRMGSWVSLGAMLPDFSQWSAEESERLAQLAECLAQKTATTGGGLQNRAPRETMAATDRLVEFLEKEKAQPRAQSSPWNRRVAAWQLLDTSSEKLSPWLDLEVAAWVDQTLASNDPQAIRVVESMGPLGDAVDQKLEAARRTLPAPVALGNQKESDEAKLVRTLEKMATHDPALALQTLDVFASAPEWANAPLNRGFRGYLRSLAAHPEGAADLTSALEVAPGEVILHLWQARVHFVGGRYREALAEFEACGQIDLQNPPRAGQAASHWMLGDKARALELFAELVAAAPAMADEMSIGGLPVPAPIKSALLEIRAAHRAPR